MKTRARRQAAPQPSQVVAHNADSTSDALAYTLLVALALQYGTQPFLNARYLAARSVDPRAVVLATEGAKAVLCILGEGGPRREHAPGVPPRAVVQKLRSTAWPAACYLFQNLALQRAYADLDSVTFNCLNQTKIVATAATLYLLTGSGQSAMQMVALVLVTAAGLLLQVSGERSRIGTSSVGTFRRGVAVRSGAALHSLKPRLTAFGAATGMRDRLCPVGSGINAVADGSAGAVLLPTGQLLHLCR